MNNTVVNVKYDAVVFFFLDIYIVVMHDVYYYAVWLLRSKDPFFPHVIDFKLLPWSINP